MKTYVRGWMGKLDGTLKLGPCLPSLHLNLPHLLRLRIGSVIPAIVNTVPQIEPRKFSRNTCQSHLSSPRDLFTISGMMTAWNHRPIRTLNAVRNTSKQPQLLGEVQKEASKNYYWAPGGGTQPFSPPSTTRIGTRSGLLLQNKSDCQASYLLFYG